MSESLESMNEYQLKMLAKKELGREILVWKKEALIKIIREHRGVPHTTPIKRQSSKKSNFERQVWGKKKTATEDISCVPPPAPGRRKVSMMNDDLMTHSAKELRDIAKDHGLPVTTWNKKKLIQMIEEARREGKRPTSPAAAPPRNPPPTQKKNSYRQKKPPAPTKPKPSPPPPVREAGNSAEVVALRKKLAEKEREIIKLRKSISHQRPPPSARKAASPRHPAQDLKKLIQEKDRQLEAVQKRQAETDNKMMSLSNELTLMKKQLSETERRVENREADLQRKMNRLEEEKEFLADELNNAHESAQKTKSELDLLRESTAGESSEMNELRGLLDAVRNEKSGLEKQVNKLQETLDKWMSEYKSLEQEKQTLHDQVSALEENNNDLVRQLTETEIEEDLAEPAPPSNITAPVTAQPAPANLSSLVTKEGESSESVSFQEKAYHDEFESKNLYNEISVYGESDSDANDLDSKQSDHAEVISRASLRTDSVSTEDTELMAYGVAAPGFDHFENHEPSETDVLAKVLDGFGMYYPCEHWWYQAESLHGGEVQGPVSFQEMCNQKGLSLETYVWNGDNVPGWTRIQDLEGLQHLLPC